MPQQQLQEGWSPATSLLLETVLQKVPKVSFSDLLSTKRIHEPVKIRPLTAEDVYRTGSFPVHEAAATRMQQRLIQFFVTSPLKRYGLPVEVPYGHQDAVILLLQSRVCIFSGDGFRLRNPVAV
jgi:hypothetical protein